jgi:23S rRNA (cytosine1962-C5)-methyltransferase
MAKVFLKKKISPRISEGHPWIYKNEIGDVVGIHQNGAIVEVFSSNGSFVGKGYYNEHTTIAIRLLTRIQENIDPSFFRKKIEAAWQLRQLLGIADNARVVNAEGDGLPGLVVDKYDAFLVLQTHTLGADLWKDTIVAVLQDLFKPLGIYERNDLSVRSLEQLPLSKAHLSTPFNTNISIRENELDLSLSLESGSRTGFYLDRAGIRKQALKYVREQHVLDLCAYTGAFALAAAKHGAKSVLALEQEGQFCEWINKSALANGLASQVKAAAVNVFDQLKLMVKNKESYGMIFLDPPVFAYSVEGLPKVRTALKELNLRAIKLVKQGGFLVTTQAHALLSFEAFCQIIREAAVDAKREIRILEIGCAGPDFPVLMQLPQNSIVQALILQVN